MAKAKPTKKTPPLTVEQRLAKLEKGYKAMTAATESLLVNLRMGILSVEEAGRQLVAEVTKLRGNESDIALNAVLDEFIAKTTAMREAMVSAVSFPQVPNVPIT